MSTAESTALAEIEHEEHDLAEAEPINPTIARNRAVADALAPAYAKASTLTLSDAESKSLAKEFPDDAFRLGAGGDPNLIYIEHAYLRERLNKTLGIGAAVPIRRREWSERFTYTDKYKKQQEGIRVYVDLVLVVRGCVVGEAIGDAVYYPSNAKTNFSDALESAKSNAFRRCCKEFGVGLQAWMKGWGDGWKKRQSGGNGHEKTADRFGDESANDTRQIKLAKEIELHIRGTLPQRPDLIEKTRERLMGVGERGELPIEELNRLGAMIEAVAKECAAKSPASEREVQHFDSVGLPCNEPAAAT